MSEKLVLAFAAAMREANAIRDRRALEDRRAKEAERLRQLFAGKTQAEVRKLWDAYDGANAPLGFSGEDIHAYLNLIGDGHYCAV